MQYRPAKEIATAWSVDVRVVQEHCKAGRIPGARKYGAAWMIPEGAKKPEDKRRRKLEAPPPLYRGIFLIENLRLDGRSVEDIAAELPDDAHRRQFFGELAYLRGDMGKALELSQDVPADSPLSLCALHLHNVACISVGDYPAFVANMLALDEMLSRYKAMPQEAACIRLSQATAITSLYAVERCPEWLRIGDFSNIPGDAKLNAVYVYARYLHSSKQTERALGVTEAADILLGGQGFTIAELYIGIMRAIALVQLGQPLRARELLLQAFVLAKPYRIYQPFSENMSSFRGVLDAALRDSYPADYKRVLEGWDAVFAGWTDIHNRLSGANVPTNLALREHQIGLYLCEGFSYKQIAARMGLSPATVSNYVKAMRDKLGVNTTAEVIRRMRWT